MGKRDNIFTIVQAMEINLKTIKTLVKSRNDFAYPLKDSMEQSLKESINQHKIMLENLEKELEKEK